MLLASLPLFLNFKCRKQGDLDIGARGSIFIIILFIFLLFDKKYLSPVRLF